MQEYARVVLDYDHPGWRSQTTVTLRIPARNVTTAGDLEGRWRNIAAEPLRNEALNELARVAHELRYADGDVRQLLPLFQQVRATRALEYPPPALWAKEIRDKLDRALLAVRFRVSGAQPHPVFVCRALSRGQ